MMHVHVVNAHVLLQCGYCPQCVEETRFLRVRRTLPRVPCCAICLMHPLLPEWEDCNGRHWTDYWMRVELGTILMKFAFEISVQLWSPL